MNPTAESNYLAPSLSQSEPPIASQRGGLSQDEKPGIILGCPTKNPVADTYFLVEKTQETFKIQGTPNAFFGHKIPTSEGEYEGTFVEWNWNGSCLEVTNDRMGFFPLFYHASENRIAVSPNLKTLIRNGISSEMDLTAISIFLRTGMYIGDDTPFKEIRVLPPNSVLRWTTNGYHLDSSLPTAIESNLSWDDAVDGYIEHFQAAMSRRLEIHGRLGLPLSGGRDSRFILLELLRNNVRPEALLTAQKPRPYRFDEDDPGVAKVVSARAGYQNIEIEEARLCLENEYRKNDLTNYCAIDCAWMIPLVDSINREGIETLYDGIGGDVMAGELFLTESSLDLFNTERIEQFASGLLTQSEALSHILAIRKHDELSPESATKRLSAEVSLHLEAPNPVGSFFFWNRTRRLISQIPHGLYQGIRLPYMPYLDMALWQHLANLDAKSLMGRSIRTDAIARAHPEWANVPYARKSPLKNSNSRPVPNRTRWRSLSIEAAASLLVGPLPPFCRRTAMVHQLGKNSLQSLRRSNRSLVSITAYLNQLASLNRSVSSTSVESTVPTDSTPGKNFYPGH